MRLLRALIEKFGIRDMEKHKEGKFLTTKAQKSKKERRTGD
jgi:hypothetical protein